MCARDEAMQYCHKFTAMTKEFVDHLVDLITNHAINAFFAPITGTPSEKERVLEALGRKFLNVVFIPDLPHHT